MIYKAPKSQKESGRIIWKSIRTISYQPFSHNGISVQLQFREL